MSKRAWGIASCLAFLALAAQPAISPPAPNTVRIEFVAKDQVSLLQVFFRLGRDFNEEDSGKRFYYPSDTVQSIDFPIPKGTIRSIRLDPLSGAGEIGIRSIAVGYRPLVRFGPLVAGRVWTAQDIVGTFRASRDVTLFRREGDLARIVSAGIDPQLVNRRDDAFVAAWGSPLKIRIRDAALAGTARLLALAGAVALLAALVKSIGYLMFRFDRSSLNRSSGYPLACAIYTAAFCAAHFRLIFTQQMPLWDALQYFHPYYILQADYIRSGRLLFWNPYAAGGVPAFVDPQMAAFSPLALLSGLLTGGTTGGYIFYWLFLLWFGGAGMILLARHLGAPLWGGVLAALGYSLSGFNTGHSEHLSWLYTAAFLPHVVYFVSRSVREDRVLCAAVGGVVIGVAGLGGYPGIVTSMCVYTAVYLAGYSLLAADGGPRRSVLPLLAKLATFTVVALLVMAPTYFGFFHEGAGINSRVGSLSKEMAQSNPIAPGALISAVSPIFPILNLYTNLWPGTDISSASIYVSSLTLLLAVLSPLNREQRALVAGTAFLTLASLAVATGDATPLRGWMYDVLPPSRYTRHPSLYRMFYIFGIAQLSLYGSAIVQKAIGKRSARAPDCMAPPIRRGIWLVAGACIASGVAWATGMRAYHTAPLQDHLAHAHLLVAWGVPLALALLLLSRCERPVLKELPVLLMGIAVAEALLNISISAPLISQQSKRFIVPSHAVELTARGFQRGYGSVDNYNFLTKIPGFVAYCPLNSRNFFYNRIAASPGLLEAVTVGDRVWLCENPVTVAPSERNFLLLEANPAFLDKFKCVVHTNEAMLGGADGGRDDTQALKSFAPSIVRLSPRVERYLPGRVEFSVDSPSDGYLFFSDRWARSWRAAVNGEPATPLGGSFIFTSLKIAKGSNRIALTYEPSIVKYLLALSCLVTIVTGLLALRSRIVHPATEPAQASGQPPASQP